MANYEAGTATGFFDFWEKLVTFLTTSGGIGAGEEWTLEEDTTSSFTDNTGHTILTTTNTEGATFCIVIYARVNAVDNQYNLVIIGARGYDVAGGKSNQPGSPTAIHTLNPPQICLQNTNTDYLFVGDKNHCVLKAQVGSVCQSSYFGFFEPYGPPSQFTHPIMFGASSGDPAIRWNLTSGNGAVWMFKGNAPAPQDLYTGSNAPTSWVCGPGGFWYPLRNADSSSDFGVPERFSMFWPPSLVRGKLTVSKSNAFSIGLDKTEGGDYPLFEITVMVHDISFGGGTWMEGNCTPIGKLYDTIKWLPGDSLNIGDVIQWDGYNWELITDWELNDSSSFAAIRRDVIV